VKINIRPVLLSGKHGRSNDIAAVTRPMGWRTYQQLLLKTGKYSSWNPLDLSLEHFGNCWNTLFSNTSSMSV